MGINGHLPNLDFVNLVNRQIQSAFGEAILEGQLEFRESMWKGVPLPDGIFPLIGNLKDHLLNMFSTLFMIKNQAIGLPTAEHGLFPRYQVDGDFQFCR